MTVRATVLLAGSITETLRCPSGLMARSCGPPAALSGIEATRTPAATLSSVLT